LHVWLPAKSQLPLQQSLLEPQLVPAPEQPQREVVLLQLLLQHVAEKHDAPSAAQEVVSTQMPSWQAASATHAPPPLQSPSISIWPAGGGPHVPALHTLDAQSVGLMHEAPSGWTGPKPPPAIE